MVATPVSPNNIPISVLVADDSIVFRRFLRDMLADSSNINIVGEAKNGIEALDLVLKVQPQVILMDMEMPLMDGMTALQHLMIHCPTPTIIFSSLTADGTFRAFDALKNGAVDFLSKDFLSTTNNPEVFRRMLTRKIQSAAQINVHSVDPVFNINQDSEQTAEPLSRVVFCEDCGARNVVDLKTGEMSEHCQNCGDALMQYDVQMYRRNAYVTVLSGGEDSFRSLLNIIPALDADLGGSVIIVIKAESDHVDTFSEYLDSISSLKVLRARDGMALEGGYCYVAASQDHISLQQLSDKPTLCRVKTLENTIGPIDLVLMTVTAEYKNKCAGIFLSGNDLDGMRGMRDMIENGGTCLVLNPTECMSSRLVRVAIEKFQEADVAKEDSDLARKMAHLYLQARYNSSIL